MECYTNEANKMFNWLQRIMALSLAGCIQDTSDLTSHLDCQLEHKGNIVDRYIQMITTKYKKPK